MDKQIERFKFVVLSRLCGQKGGFFSASIICRYTHLSKEQKKQAIDELEEKKLVKIKMIETQRKGRPRTDICITAKGRKIAMNSIGFKRLIYKKSDAKF